MVLFRFLDGKNTVTWPGKTRLPGGFVLLIAMWKQGKLVILKKVCAQSSYLLMSTKNARSQHGATVQCSFPASHPHLQHIGLRGRVGPNMPMTEWRAVVASAENTVNAFGFVLRA